MRALTCLIALLLIGCQSADTARTSMVSTTPAIQSVQGQAELRRADASWQRAEPGQRLSTGDELRTSVDSRLNLNLGSEAGILTLHPNSALSIDQLGATGTNAAHAVLTLTRGRISGDTLRDPGQTRIIVNTPGGSVNVP